MNDKRKLTLDLISRVDEEVLDRNLDKRYLLWQRRERRKKRNTLISILSLAASVAIVVSSLFLFLPGAPTPDSDAPIYQGMTVSNVAPSLAPVSAEGGGMSVSPLSAKDLFSGGVMPIGDGDNGNHFGNDHGNNGDNGNNGNHFGNGSGEGKDPSLDFTSGPYYAQPGEDIYIHIHFSNPKGYDIISFTLNGVKYTSYMFEEGSDLETLILKCNVGSEIGVKQYTIDAIKYIDGEVIKDVRMKGDKTVEVLVGKTETALQLNAQFEGWILNITPVWSDSFQGDKTLLSLAVYDGETLVRDLGPNNRVVNDLPQDRSLVLAATYLENGKTVTAKTVIQTPKQSEGLTVVNGVITGIGTCTDTTLYLNMPIAKDAFKGNTYITHVLLGHGVTEYAWNAFNDCPNLTSVTFSSGIEEIGSFYNCPNLTSVSFPAGTKRVVGFYSCPNLTSVTFPDGIKKVSGFSNTKLTSVTFPNGIEEVNGFDNCPNLTSVTFPDGIKKVSGFSNTKLTSVTLPDSVEKIGDGSFSNCAALSTITLPSGLKTVNGFYDCPNLTSVTFPAGIKEVSGFSNTKLTSITFPDGIEAVYGFYNCPNLTSVTFPTGTKIIGGFSNTKLTSVTLPDTVEKIGDESFSNCAALSTVTLPAGLKEIGQGSFCTSQLKIYYGGTTTQWCHVNKETGLIPDITVHCTNGDIAFWR